MLTSIPVIGLCLAEWIWGCYSVDSATLTRFFAFHFTLPFLIETLSAVHLVALHSKGSNSPLAVNSMLDYVPLHPYYAVKDIYGLLAFYSVFLYLAIFSPKILGQPDNFMMATPLITPHHIVPEWYLLPFYAILRSTDVKWTGILALLGAIVMLEALPLLPFTTSASFLLLVLRYQWLDREIRCLSGGKPNV